MTDPDSLEPWLATLAAALAIDPAVVDIARLLDVAREAAHGVARPAAPLTTFLIGLAAGLRGGSQLAISEAADVAQRLARTYPETT